MRPPFVGVVMAWMICAVNATSTAHELREAAKAGNLQGVQTLLLRGAGVNDKGNNDWTALHWAAWQGHLTVADILVQKGAQINAQDKYGHTALYEAAYHGNLQVARLLLEHGARTDTLTSRGRHMMELRGNPHQEDFVALVEDMTTKKLLGWKLNKEDV